MMTLLRWSGLVLCTLQCFACTKTHGVSLGGARARTDLDGGAVGRDSGDPQGHDDDSDHDEDRDDDEDRPLDVADE